MDDRDDPLSVGYELVRPYLHLEDDHKALPPDDTLVSGIQLLEGIRAEDQWETSWILGKAYEATGDYETSCSCFGEAYGIGGRGPDVEHEYIVALLRVNRVELALEIANSSSSKDERIVFDTALALYVIGRCEEALNILDGAVWSHEHVERASELRRRVLRAVAE